VGESELIFINVLTEVLSPMHKNFLTFNAGPAGWSLRVKPGSKKYRSKKFTSASGVSKKPT